MDADSYPYILWFILCVMVGALCSAMETAYSAANRMRIRAFSEDGDSRYRAADTILDHFDEALTAVLIINNVMHTAAASIATLLTVRCFGNGSVSAATLVVTVTIFFLGEMLPKRFAKDRADDFALFCAPLLLTSIRVLRPLTRLFMHLSEGLARRFPAPEEPTYTEDELHELVENLEDDGVIEPAQQELVESAMDFGGKRAGSIYRPMEQVTVLYADNEEDEILRIMREKRFSRYPVVDRRSGRVIGMLQSHHYLSARARGERADLRHYMTTLHSYGAAMHIDDLMHAMNRRRQHMALVVDDGLRTLGIVTMEDILEELVGEIYDEKDPSTVADFDAVTAG